MPVFPCAVQTRTATSPDALFVSVSLKRQKKDMSRDIIYNYIELGFLIFTLDDSSTQSTLLYIIFSVSLHYLTIYTVSNLKWRKARGCDQLVDLSIMISK